MIISKAIRHLAERLGIKATGTGISDAIMDLADGFPFYEETIEKVTVIGEKTAVADEDGLISTGAIWLESGNTYRVTINNEVFENVAGSSNAVFGNYRYLIIIADVSDEFVGFAGLTPGVNYHIKVETVETETVVKQLAPKFRGFGEEVKTEYNVLYDNFAVSKNGTFGNAKFYSNSDWGEVNNFVVIFDGVEYNFEFEVPKNTGYNYKFGNLSLADSSKENTGEPFCLESYFWLNVDDMSEYKYDKIYLAEQGVNHTLSIKKKVEQTIVTRLPAKFLPEPIVFTTGDMQTFTCNKSYAECVSAFNDNNFNAYFKGFNSEGMPVAAPTQSVIKYNDHMFYFVSVPDGNVLLEYYADGNITVEMSE